METLITVVEMIPSQWVLWPLTSVTLATLSMDLIAKLVWNQTRELEYLTHHKHQSATVSNCRGIISLLSAIKNIFTPMDVNLFFLQLNVIRSLFHRMRL